MKGKLVKPTGNGETCTDESIDVDSSYSSYSTDPFDDIYPPCLTEETCTIDSSYSSGSCSSTTEEIPSRDSNTESDNSDSYFDMCLEFRNREDCSSCNHNHVSDDIVEVTPCSSLLSPSSDFGSLDSRTLPLCNGRLQKILTPTASIRLHQ